jgi:AcrR family transcriptional regulator
MFDMRKAATTTRKPRRRAPQPASSDATRDKLMDAAGRVFADRGYDAATVREICRLAHANVAAVNYHFRDKQGLYAEILSKMKHAAQLERMSATLTESAPPEEILRRAIKVRIQGLRTDRLPDWHFRILAREFAHPTPAMTRMIDEIAKPLYGRLLSLVGQLIGRPADDEKTRLCTQSVWGQIFLYALACPVLTRLWPEMKMTPDQLDRIADHIADFSLAYLREIRSAQKQLQPVASSRRP